MISSQGFVKRPPDTFDTRVIFAKNSVLKPIRPENPNAKTYDGDSRYNINKVSVKSKPCLLRNILEEQMHKIAENNSKFFRETIKSQKCRISIYIQMETD